MARSPSQRNKRHPYDHMDRHLPNMDTLPDALWMEPWRGGWDAPRVQSVSELPRWMSEAARAEILSTVDKDPGNNGRWWVNLWQEHAPQGDELLFVATAMAATVGWVEVVKDLLARGAPLQMDRPATGWKWLGGPRLKMSKEHMSILDLCAWAMRGDNAASPLHHDRVRCLNVLFESGARVEHMQSKTCVEMMSHEHLAKWFIAHGLTADRAISTDQILFDALFVPFPKISPNVHGRIITAFIDHGMPVRFTPEGPSIVQRMAKTVAGLTQIHRLAVHPDREGICQAFHEAAPVIQKSLSRRSQEDQAAFTTVFEVMMLDLDTPKAQAMRARARL